MDDAQEAPLPPMPLDLFVDIASRMPRGPGAVGVACQGLHQAMAGDAFARQWTARAFRGLDAAALTYAVATGSHRLVRALVALRTRPIPPTSLATMVPFLIKRSKQQGCLTTLAGVAGILRRTQAAWPILKGADAMRLNADLLDAVEERDPARITGLFEDDAARREPVLWSPVDVAIVLGDAACLEALRPAIAGADVTDALLVAATLGRAGCCAALAPHAGMGIMRRSIPLVASHDPACLQAVLPSAMDVWRAMPAEDRAREMDPRRVVLYAGSRPCVEWLLRSTPAEEHPDILHPCPGDAWSPLHNAATDPHSADVLGALLALASPASDATLPARSAYTDHVSASPLHCAVYAGSHHCVAKLLARADVRKRCIEQRDGLGMTPLHACVSSRGGGGIMADIAQCKCVKLLLVAGADHASRTDDGGQTALHLAAAKGHAVCTMLLMDAGADACALDGAGITPLEAAERAGNAACADAIVRMRQTTR